MLFEQVVVAQRELSGNLVSAAQASHLCVASFYALIHIHGVCDRRFAAGIATNLADRSVKVTPLLAVL